ARVLQSRTRTRSDPGRDDDLELPASARSAWTDEDGVRSGSRVSRSARRVAARWHDRRCDINRRLAVHQERGGQARSADAFLEEGQSMVLRHEGARERRCHQRACAYRRRDERQRARCEDDTAVYGDKGYANGAKKRAAEAAAVLWAVKEKAKPGGRLTARQRARNHRFGNVRAKVEHVFRVVKCQFGYRKVRYRGIAKNGAQVFSLLALANLYLARRTFASA